MSTISDEAVREWAGRNGFDAFPLRELRVAIEDAQSIDAIRAREQAEQPAGGAVDVAEFWVTCNCTDPEIEQTILRALRTPPPAQCPHIVTNGTTSYCRLAESAGAPPAQVPDELRACQRRIHGFMLDCNAIGLLGAAENLHKGLKQDAAMLAAAPTPPSADQ